MAFEESLQEDSVLDTRKEEELDDEDEELYEMHNLEANLIEALKDLHEEKKKNKVLSKQMREINEALQK